MELAEIGLVGLGVMGSNLALNIAEHGHRIAVWNRELPRLPEFMRDAGDLAKHIVPTETIEQLIADSVAAGQSRQWQTSETTLDAVILAIQQILDPSINKSIEDIAADVGATIMDYAVRLSSRTSPSPIPTSIHICAAIRRVHRPESLAERDQEGRLCGPECVLPISDFATPSHMYPSQ